MREFLLAGLVVLLAPAAAHAQVQLGLRAGYGLSGGDAYSYSSRAIPTNPSGTAKMSDSLRAQLPIQLDAMYGSTRDLAGGVYLAYGFGQLGDTPCSRISCNKSGHDLRLGVQGIYTFSKVGGPFLPWAGLFLGWEQAVAEYKFTIGSLNGQSAKYTLSGWEAGLQVGGDLMLGERLSVGPYLTYSFARYTTRDVAPPASLGNVPLDLGATTHTWLGFGVAGKFRL